MAQELIIKINGDVENFNKALKDVQKQTEGLDESLSTIARNSAVAFAGFTAAIVANAAAFRDKEQTDIRTQQIIKATGEAAGITAKRVAEIAEEFQNLTTFEGTAIQQGQNVLLTFKNIGSDVFPRTTMAMLDMATTMGGDLTSNAQKLGKALDNPILGMDSLTKVGIRFTEQQKQQIITLQSSGDIAKAQAIILKELESRFGGTAKAASQGSGVFLQLKNTISGLAEDIGKELMPGLIKLAQVGMQGLLWVKEHEGLKKFTANLLMFGAGLSGSVLIFTKAAQAAMGFRAVMLALQTATSGFLTTTRVLVGATGLGLLLVLVADLSANWKKRMEQMQAIYKTFAENIGSISRSVADLLIGVFTFDLTRVKRGFDNLKNVAIKSFEELVNDPAFKDAPNPYAPEPEATRKLHQQNLEETKRAYEALKEEQLKKNEEDLGIALTKDEEMLERKIVSDQLALDAEIAAANARVDKAQTEQERLTAIKDRAALIDKKRDEMGLQRQYLTNQQRKQMDHEINQALVDNAFASGQALVNASGSNAKKQFLISQALGVAQAIMNAYMASSLAMATIPPPAGEAIAAQRLTVGLVNAATIAGTGMVQYQGMAEGGTVLGGIPGVDSVPIMAQQGEIVAPVQNFNEVIGSVRAQREAEKRMEFARDGEQGQVMRHEVWIGFKDNAFRILEAQRKGALSIGVIS